MSPVIAESLCEAFLEHRELFGVIASFGDTGVVVVAGESAFSRELREGGFAETGDVAIKYLIADLSTAPAKGDPVTYKSRLHRVESIATQPGSLVGELSLRPARR